MRLTSRFSPTCCAACCSTSAISTELVAAGEATTGTGALPSLAFCRWNFALSGS